MRSVALFLPNWIGDAVMATPAVRGVREHFPTARVVAVCRPYVAAVVARSPRVDAVVPFFRNNLFSVIRSLAAHRPDAAVLFPNSFRAAAVARLAGCQTVVGFARYFRDPLLTDRLYPARGVDGRPKPLPVIDDYNRLVERLGVPCPGHRMELFPTAPDESGASATWNDLSLHRYPRVIGLNPGGAFGAAKHWPVEHFAAVAREYAVRGYGVLVLCGPAERDEARQIVATASRAGVVSLADCELSIGLTMACVRRLACLVTTDSGPRHFASAFGVPVVTLFGPTHIAWTETYDPTAVHLQRKLPCGPCQQRVCPLGHHRCMTELTPADVIAAADRLLATSEVRRAG